MVFKFVVRMIKTKFLHRYDVNTKQLNQVLVSALWGASVCALKVPKMVLFLQLIIFFGFVECGVDPSLLSDTRLERLRVLLSLDALGAT